MRDIPLKHLESCGLLEPVASGGRDERLWLDCDLASLAEHRLGDTTGPFGLTDARREDWQARATADKPHTLDRRNGYERCYWLLEGAERVGTIALSRMAYGMADARVSSLYVFPSRRGRGVGQRALERLGAALADQDCGYRLDTCWAWQRVLRFYLRRGLWVYMWKRELTLHWARALPRHLIEVTDEAVTLSAQAGDRRVVLATGRTHGDRLELDVPPPETWEGTPFHEVAWNADSTLSLALALEGRAMRRSPEDAERCRGADCGAPEALARKIEIWEAHDRAYGWKVETPRIPGLEYPSWAELEARWEAERAAFEAELAARHAGTPDQG